LKTTKIKKPAMSAINTSCLHHLIKTLAVSDYWLSLMRWVYKWLEESVLRSDFSMPLKDGLT